jgi:hypothetical protein
MTNICRRATTHRRRASNTQSWLRLAFAGMIGIVLAGCGPGVPAGKVKLTGTVTFDGKPLVAGVFNSAAINFAAKQGNASGAAALSQEGAFTVYLVPGEYDVAVRDNGGGMRPPEKPGSPPTYYPGVIATRYTSANTSGISVTAAADSKPVTIAIEKR